MSSRSCGSWWASTADSDSTAARAPSDTKLPAPRVSTGKPVASPAERCWRLRRLHTLGKKVPLEYAVLFGSSTGHRCSSDMLLNRTSSALLRCLHLPHSHPVAQRLDPGGLALGFLLRLLESDDEIYTYIPHHIHHDHHYLLTSILEIKSPPNLAISARIASLLISALTASSPALTGTVE